MTNYIICALLYYSVVKKLRIMKIKTINVAM